MARSPRSGRGVARSATITAFGHAGGSHDASSTSCSTATARSHRNPVNKAIHWVCVPLITWSVLAALWVASPVADVHLHRAGDRLLRVAVDRDRGRHAGAGRADDLAGAAARTERAVDRRRRVRASPGSASSSATRSRAASRRSCEDLKFLLIGPAWLLQFVYRGGRHFATKTARATSVDRAGPRPSAPRAACARARARSSRRRRRRARRTGRGPRTRGRGRFP